MKVAGLATPPRGRRDRSIFGYGLSELASHLEPEALLDRHMKVISAGACKRAYPHAIIASEICGQDLTARSAPLVQACPGDSGGPFIRQTSQGPVQIGITSWGPEVKDAKCGRRHLPGVYMRTVVVRVVHQRPEPGDPAVSRDRSRARFTQGHGHRPKVGQTLTCDPAQFGGSPATLSYRWIFNFKTVSRKQTIVVTKRDDRPRAGCHVTARNAGGRYVDDSPRVGDLVIGS